MDAVIPYPPTAAGGALRRRNVPRLHAAEDDNDGVVPPETEPDLPMPRERRRERRARARNDLHRQAVQSRKRFSRRYCMASTVAAILAIVIVAPPPVATTMSSSRLLENNKSASDSGVVDLSVVENVAKAAAMGLKSNELTDAMSSEQQHKQQKAADEEHHGQLHPQQSEMDLLIQSVWELIFPSPARATETRTREKESSKKHHNHHFIPPPLRWMFPSHQLNHHSRDETDTRVHSQNMFKDFLIKLVDPAILNPGPSSMTDILDKVLQSNFRLILLANLLLSMTFLVYTAIVHLFLGSDPSIPRELGFWTDEPSVHGASNPWAGRERIGGFLVFKLLLISAVVVPDKLDLMILLSWYTLLSFLRSLAHLAAATTSHTSQSGQSPRKGVLRLLLAVLLSDAFAAAVCVALFHGAGWGMVLLLACDCALLGVEVLCHILRHMSQALEERHSDRLREMEDRQLELHRILREASTESMQDENEESNQEQVVGHEEHEIEEEESRQLDRRMEIREGVHSRRLAVLDATTFFLEVVAYTLTVGHFCHIWSLHGLHFTLIDGVLALHLHSAFSSLGKKIAERRNLNRVARALDGLFENATELEMRKASVTGDVCCICLGTMTVGHVKKVGCGHLYHTRCLREVVERARSIEAARCPLCRASVVDGRHSDVGRTNGSEGAPPQQDVADARNANQDRQLAEDVLQQQPQGGATGLNINGVGGGRERALFRFSTENILPAWLPLPALSFEVVRRPSGPAAPAAPETGNNNGGTLQQQPQQQQQQQQSEVARNNGARPQEGAPSFWRRILLLSGAIQMSPEEEALSLDQLVDMFPQYERADLQRELRQRGSAEAVVESVLQGVFSGVARDGAVAAPMEANSQEEEEEANDDNVNVVEEQDQEDLEQ